MIGNIGKADQSFILTTRKQLHQNSDTMMEANNHRSFAYSLTYHIGRVSSKKKDSLSTYLRYTNNYPAACLPHYVHRRPKRLNAFQWSM